jgi:acetylornithine deacetylase/succinyl-diaminopimelate desuccinylase-like protein
VRGIRVGGVQALGTNTISTEAHASIDFRLVPDQTPRRVRELVERHIEARGYYIARKTPTPEERARHPKIVRMEWGEGYPANRSFMEHPFARAMERAIADGAPAPPLIVPRLGGSGPDYLFTEVLGVPVSVLPIANHDNNQHAANENIRIKNLRDGIELYAGLLARLGVEWGRAVVP